MKKTSLSIVTLCGMLAAGGSLSAQENSSASEVDFGTFKPSGSGTFVEIKVSTSLIQMAARITEDSEPEVAKILGGLKSIRVNVLEFGEDEETQIKQRVETIRGQLDQEEWERVVTVKEDETDVGIYAKLNGSEAIEGLVVTVIEGEQVVLVHVDGKIKPEELAQVGERLNLPPLQRIGAMMGEKH